MPAISRHERRRIGPEFRRMIGAREMIDRTVMLDGKGGVALHRHPVALEIAHRVIAAYRDVAAVNTDLDRLRIGLRREGRYRQRREHRGEQRAQGLVFHALISLLQSSTPPQPPSPTRSRRTQIE